MTSHVCHCSLLHAPPSRVKVLSKIRNPKRVGERQRLGPKAGIATGDVNKTLFLTIEFICFSKGGCFETHHTGLYSAGDVTRNYGEGLSSQRQSFLKPTPLLWAHVPQCGDSCGRLGGL
jgi:hypothetical protein